jgi:hypothetical protein
MLMLNRTFLTAGSALALAACASGPDYKPQPISASAAAPFVSATGTQVSDAKPTGDWWRL